MPRRASRKAPKTVEVALPTISPIERCPPEILSRVFVLVCSDGGRMGCTLRLVSKRIAAQAKPFRFWSVCIAGVKQFSAFEKAVIKVGASLRRVQYFMLSDKPGTWTMKGERQSRSFARCHDDDLVQMEDLYSGNCRLTIAQRAGRRAILDECEEFAKLLTRTMGHLASHLKSFTLLLFNIHYPRFFEIFRTRPFPRLLHFALYHKGPEVATVRDCPKSIRMPVLESLTLGIDWTAQAAWPWIRLFLSNCDWLETMELRGLTWKHSTRNAARCLLGKEPVDSEVADFIPLIWASNDTWTAASESEPLPHPVSTLHLRELGRNSYVNTQGAAERQKEHLVDDGVRTVELGNGLPNYAKLKQEWMEMLEEKALIFAEV